MLYFIIYNSLNVSCNTHDWKRNKQGQVKASFIGNAVYKACNIQLISLSAEILNLHPHCGFK